MSKTFTAEGIIADILAGKEVNILGVAKFTPYDKAASVARNPSTGAQIDVPAHKSIKVSVSGALKKRLKGA